MLTSFSNVFVGQYGFSTSTSGLPYLGIAVGFGVGVLISSTYSDRIASALTLRNGGVRNPAFRLPLMAWSCWIPPIALAGYGWSAFYKLHFMVPIAAVAVYSIALQLIMVCLPTHPVAQKAFTSRRLYFVLLMLSTRSTYRST